MAHLFLLFGSISQILAPKETEKKRGTLKNSAAFIARRDFPETRRKRRRGIIRNCGEKEWEGVAAKNAFSGSFMGRRMRQEGDIVGK